MPTSTERIDRCIYCAHWRGVVQLNEVFEARDGLERLAVEDGCSQYVIMIDGKTVKTVPMDLRILTKTFADGAVALVVSNAPYSGQIVARMVNKFVPISIEVFNDFEEARIRAIELRDALISKNPT